MYIKIRLLLMPGETLALLTYAPYVSLLAQHIFYLIVKARLIIYGQMYYDKTILELMKH